MSKIPNALRCAAVLIAVTILTSCNPDRLTNPTPPAPNADLLGDVLDGATTTLSGVTGTLLKCRPLPYASDQEWIGPFGGQLRIGPHTLTIPPGALSRWVRITGDAPSDDNRTVRLYPEGLQFERPASLTLSYSGCGLVVGLLPRVAYTTDRLVILEYLPSFNNLFNQTVTGRLEHFSRYAAAW